MTTEAPPLTMSLSLSRKINTGNYESVDVFVSVSGITAETTEAEIEQLLGSRIAWDAIRHDLRAKSEEVIGKAMWGR